MWLRFKPLTMHSLRRFLCIDEFAIGRSPLEDTALIPLVSISVLNYRFGFRTKPITQVVSTTSHN